MPEEEPLVIPLDPIAPGPEPPVRKESRKAAEIEGNQEHIAAGKQLYAAMKYAAMKCVGCHFHGGGGMGPPLMDDTWIYGSSIENIVATIREGRPAGMPSFRGRLPDEQIWQIAAYVQTLPKHEPK